MHVDWTALGEVTAVSIAVTVGVVVVFALGVLGVSQVEAAREKDAGGTHARLRTGRTVFPGLRGDRRVRNLPDRAAVPLK